MKKGLLGQRAEALGRAISILIIIGCWMYPSHLQAQSSDFPVSGQVTHADNNSPMAGVAVLIKGTTVGSYTDGNGEFSLNLSSQNTTLIFSFLGFENQEIEVNGRSTINVQLTETVSILDEVVVTGYATQRAREVTSSIASVKAEDFNKGNITNPTQLLQGKVAGVSVSAPGGDPNGGFNIRLRGLSTIGANAQPLIIIDGVIGGALESVDPNDIQSIDVLKDGSAAAIYGTRASSGVIIITTKKGIPGSTSVEYNGFGTLESIARKVPLVDGPEYVSLGGPDLGSNTDWIEEITRNARSHVHNLSFSGGTTNTTYRFSLNYRDVEGIVKNSGFDQLNGRLNLTQKALDGKLVVALNISNTIRNQDEIDNTALEYAVTLNPTAPVFDNSELAVSEWGGYYTPFGAFRSGNPLALIEQQTRERELKDLVLNARADYEIFPGFKAGIFFAEQRETDLFNFYNPKNAYPGGLNANGQAERRTDDRLNRLLESMLNYETDIGGLNLKLLGGYSYNELESNFFRAQGGNFLTDAFTFNNLGAAADFNNGLGTVESNRESSKLIAFFGRANLNFDDTYYLSASVRREGSSRFGSENKWGTFPAVSAGVVLSNLFQLPGVNNLKLRAGFGVTGAIPPSSYISLERLSPGSSFFFNGEYVNSFGPASNPNPNLKWERKNELDIGLDFELFDYRITGSFDYYDRTTNDLLFEFTVPVPPNLFDRLLANVGEINNKGFEAQINIQAIDRPNFTWDPAITFSTNSAKLVSLSNEDFDFGSFRKLANLGSPGLNAVQLVRVEEGKPLGQLWGPVYDGLDAAGIFQFQDLNGDGNIDDDDETVIGNALPDFEFGLNNTFTFGDFDFNFFLRGAVGHDLINTFRIFYEVQSNASFYNVVKTDLFLEGLNDAPQYSSYYVEDATFIRLDNATLGYTVPLAKGGQFNRIRIYATTQNLFTITDYQGINPEVRYTDTNQGGANSILSPGIERRQGSYFTTRNISVGVNVGFR